jgi:hypothetical protein
MRGDKAVEVLLFTARVGARGVLRVAVGLGLLGTTVGRTLRTIDVWGIGCCAIFGARIGWGCLDRESLWNGNRVSVLGALPWFILNGAMVFVDELV